MSHNLHTLGSQIRDVLPATSEQVAKALHLPREQIRHRLSALKAEGLVDKKRIENSREFMWELT